MGVYLCQIKMKKVSIFQALSILKTSFLAAVLGTNSLQHFPFDPGPPKSCQWCTGHLWCSQFCPEGQENIPELCEPRERVVTCLSAQAELQNHVGYDLGTSGLKHHLQLHQEDLFHARDHRRAKDLKKKWDPPCGVSLIWCIRTSWFWETES